MKRSRFLGMICLCVFPFLCMNAGDVNPNDQEEQFTAQTEDVVDPEDDQNPDAAEDPDEQKDDPAQGVDAGAAEQGVADAEQDAGDAGAEQGAGGREDGPGAGAGGAEQGAGGAGAEQGAGGAEQGAGGREDGPGAGAGGAEQGAGGREDGPGAGAGGAEQGAGGREDGPGAGAGGEAGPGAGGEAGPGAGAEEEHKPHKTKEQQKHDWGEIDWEQENLIVNDGLKVGGTLDGWGLYTGLYFPVVEGEGEDAVYSYVYSWEKTTEAQAKKDQRMMLSSDLGQTDPIIACSDFYVNPDNEAVIQIGRNNGYAEGRNKKDGAYAERMHYTFVVNEQSTLFTYKYACVLHVPTNDKHESYQMPAFYVDVSLYSPEGKEVTLNCMSFSGNASFNNSLIQNPATCTEAKVEHGRNTSDEQRPEDYVYQPWSTVSYDLTDYIGYTIVIDIITHDCLVDAGNDSEMAGSHKAYGYFWGKTEPLRLIPRNCGNDDAVITAPEGFVSYNWYRCDDYMPLSSTDNVAVIPMDEIVDGAHYCCEMIGSNSACTKILADTVLTTIVLEPNFDYKDTCNMTVDFIDKSVVKRDEIKTYRWDFGDGYYSAEASPRHEYKSGGEYEVSLTVISNRGCSSTFTKMVKVNPKPILTIDGDQNVCYGDMIVLSCLSSQIGNKFFWVNQTGDTISNDISMSERAETSQTYRVSIIDQFNCQYDKEVYVGVSSSPTIYIKGDSSVCYNTPAKLWVWGDADKFIWSSVTEGDTLHFTPQQNTTYCVTGTYTATGCKTTKCVNVVVNPLPVITAYGPDDICSGEQAVLTASGAAEYFWMNVYPGDTLTVTPLETTTYTVAGTDTNGCVGTTQYKQVVIQSPKITVYGNREICEGEQLNLWVEGAQSYVWDDETEGSVVNRMPTLNTTQYWVEGANGKCKTKEEIPIMVNPVPMVAIYGKNEICAGEAVSLYAQGADSYEWSTGEASSTLSKTLTSSQIFYVKGTSDQGCVASASYQVNVHPIPSFTIDGPESVCAGSLVTLVASDLSGSSVFQWSNGLLGATCQTYMDETTTFEVVGTDTLSGCFSKRNLKVDVIPLPEVVVTGVTTVCRGLPVSLTATGASSYVWNDGSTSNTFVSTPNTNLSLWVEGTTGGCTARVDVPVTVLPAPIVWVDGKTDLCQGDSLNLIARGADSFVWNALVDGDRFSSKPSLSATVTVVGTNDNGCATKVEVPFTVSPNPFITIEGADKVCENSSVTLTATGEDLAQFIWSTGETEAQVTEPVAGEKLFEVRAWNSHGCSGTATKKVHTVLPPVLSYTGETNVCQGDDVVLLAAGASNYTWKKTDNLIQDGERLVYTPENNTLITLIGSEGDCSSTLDIYVTVSPMPTLNVMGETTVCKNQSFTLTASGADEYVWSTGDSTATISYSLSNSATYMVKGRLIDGCYAKKTIKVEVYPDLNVSLKEVRKKGCPGDPTEVFMEAEGASYYVWSSDPQNITISGTSSYDLDALIDEPTMVYVVGTDVNGCQGTDSMLIKPKDHNEMTFQILPPVIEREDPTVHFRGFFPKNTKWSWDPGDGSDVLEGEDVVYMYNDVDVVTEDSFRVYMRARSEDGCVFQHSSYVYVWKDFWAPNVFTPNGDGLNDVFRFLGGEYIDDFQFTIYNRCGETVFVGESIDDKWDGFDLNGNPCPNGVYGWYVNYYSNYKGIGKSGERKGYVTILK